MPITLRPVEEASSSSEDLELKSVAHEVTLKRIATRLDNMHAEIMETLLSHDRRIRQLELRAMATGLVGGGLAALLGQLAQWSGQ